MKLFFQETGVRLLPRRGTNIAPMRVQSIILDLDGPYQNIQVKVCPNLKDFAIDLLIRKLDAIKNDEEKYCKMSATKRVLMTVKRDDATIIFYHNIIPALQLLLDCGGFISKETYKSIAKEVEHAKKGFYKYYDLKTLSIENNDPEEIPDAVKEPPNKEIDEDDELPINWCTLC